MFTSALTRSTDGNARRLYNVTPEVMGMVTHEPPSNWTQHEKRVYERDEYRCQTCGQRGKPHGHADLYARQVVPSSRGGCHHPRNLLTHCRRCRDQVHETHRLGAEDRIIHSIYNQSTDASVETDEHMLRIIGGGCVVLPVLLTFLFLLF